MIARASTGFGKTLTLDHESLGFPFLSLVLLTRDIQAATFQQPTYRVCDGRGVLQPGEPSCDGRVMLLVPESSMDPASAAEHISYFPKFLFYATKSQFYSLLGADVGLKSQS